jgi:hypothetical protein
MEKYRIQTKESLRILPPFGHPEIVPDAEHTVLFGLSIATLLATVLSFFRSDPSRSARYEVSTKKKN